jgi:hypothetical protein
MPEAVRNNWKWVLSSIGAILVFVSGALWGAGTERGQYKEKVDNLERRMTPVEQAVVELKEMNRELKTRQDMNIKEVDRLRGMHEAKK